MNQTELNKSRIADYNKAHVNDSAFSICDEWDESKHPRAANGQFGSGGATSAPAKASKAPAKANTSTPAKTPAQAKSTSKKAAKAGDMYNVRRTLFPAKSGKTPLSINNLHMNPDFIPPRLGGEERENKFFELVNSAKGTPNDIRKKLNEITDHYWGVNKEHSTDDKLVMQTTNKGQVFYLVFNKK